MIVTIINIILSAWVLVGRIFCLADMLKRLHIPFWYIFTNKVYHTMLAESGFYGYLTPLMLRYLKGPVPPKNPPKDYLEE